MTRTLVAVNTAPDSENRMHGDAATTYGFRGGLVPGVDVLAYVVDAGLDRWATAWLGGGRLRGRLVVPVYDGESIDVVTSEAADGAVQADVVGPDGVVRSSTALSRLDDATREGSRAEAAAADIPYRSLPEPDDRPAAGREHLQPGTVLGTQHAGFHAERAVGYLTEISESAPAFVDDHLAHPGWLLRFANWALSNTVRLGPWIHVSSDLRMFDPVRDGDQLEVRARVTDRYERKGHELVDLLAVYLVDGRAVASCDHRAIWQPRVTR